MRFLSILVAAGCISLLSARSEAGGWPADDIMNPSGFLPVATTGAPEHLTGVASDGHYGVIIGWQNDADGRAYAERLDPDQRALGLEDLDADLARMESRQSPPAAKDEETAPGGRPTLGDHLPRDEVICDVGHEQCPDCGSAP